MVINNEVVVRWGIQKTEPFFSRYSQGPKEHFTLQIHERVNSLLPMSYLRPCVQNGMEVR